MSDFIDKFSAELGKEKSRIAAEIDTDLDIRLLDNMREKFGQVYTEKTISEKKGDFRVIATDAGRNDIELKNNSRIYVLQGAAVDSSGGVSREIDVGSLKIFRQQDYESFMQRGSEVVEIKSVLKALEDVEDEKVYILIDGTLLTRLLAGPEVYDLSRSRLMSIELIEQFQKLVQIAAEEPKIVLAGVSKDSNSSLLYRKLLGEMIESKIDNLDSNESKEVGEEDLEYLKEHYQLIRYRPNEIRGNLENLRHGGLNKEKVSELENLIEQYRIRYSDTQIIEEMTDETGFTKPLRLGRIKPQFFSSMEEFREDGRKFSEKLLEHEDDPNMNPKELSNAIGKILDAPGVISSYWKPSETDTPLRIDLLNHDVDGQKLMECKSQEFIDQISKLEDILELLQTGYAGEGMHNVWISQADNSASLKNRDIEDIYKPVLEKNLEINLRNYMRRRDKRV